MSHENIKKNLSSFLNAMDEWKDVKKWDLLIPDLSCKGSTSSKLCAVQVEEGLSNSLLDETTQATKNLMKDGYALINKQPCDSFSNVLVQKLAAGISTLHKTLMLPATFILLYDEAWELAATGSQILLKTTHSKNIFNFDVLAWYIDPSAGSAGFSPHRDRQPINKEVRSSFHDDGQAKYVTLWMALSDATPENSCIYVIPKDCDPGYLSGDDDDDDDDDKHENEEPFASATTVTTPVQQDPLSRCLQSKESYQNIRALPRQVGESIAFTHRIIHWGSRGNSSCTHPRIAISFVTSDPSFEKPYLRHFEKYWNVSRSNKEDKSGSDNGSIPKVNTLPPFHIRLLLVCAQLLIYWQRFDLPKETIRSCYEYCKEYREELEESYWKKVSFEFVNALKEENGKQENIDTEKGKRQGESDEDEDELLLDAMLENVNEVVDDFDDMSGVQEGDGGAEEDQGDDFDDEEEEYCDLFAARVDNNKISEEKMCDLFTATDKKESLKKRQRKI